MNDTFKGAADRAAQAGPSELDNLVGELDERSFRREMSTRFGADIGAVEIKLHNLEESKRGMPHKGLEVKPTLLKMRDNLARWLDLLKRDGGAAVQPQQPQQQSSSKAWLTRAKSNAAEGQRPSRDYGGLDQDSEDFRNNPALKVQRGQPPQVGSIRAQQAVSLAQQQGAKRAGSKQQPTEMVRCEGCHEYCNPSSLGMVKVEGVELQICYGCRQEINPAEAGKAGGRVQGMEDTRNIKGAPLKQQPAREQSKLKQSKLPLSNLPRKAFYGGSSEPAYGQLDFVPSSSVAGPAQRPAAATVAAPAARQQAQQQQKQQQRGGNGAAGRQQQQQQQQQRRQPQRQKAGSDSDWAPDKDKEASGIGVARLFTTSARATRRRAQQQQQHDGMGTEDNPIHLLSDDDDPAPAAAAAAPAQRPKRAGAYMTTAQKFEGLKCLYPPPDRQDRGEGAVEVTALDLSRLDSDEFLNDTVIDFYLRWLRDQVRGGKDADRVHFFNSFFYKKLTENNGGTLPDDLIEYYKHKQGYKPAELQAVRNHQKVKNWTKSVDIFSKDYIIVPIHDTLHWSLAIICHPGAEPTKDPEALKTPCILHLDSMTGGHNTDTVGKILQQYLKHEWDSKARDPEARGVPKRWLQEHPGSERPDFTKAAVPCKRLKVPKQNNFCDCGLFLCTYTEFFLHSVPPGINIVKLERLNKDYAKHRRDLLDGVGATEDNLYYYLPGYLMDKWFLPVNASNLRYEMRRKILELMAEQGSFATRVQEQSSSAARAQEQWIWPGPEEMAQMDPHRRELVKRLRDELEALQKQCAASQYQRPEDLRSSAWAAKMDLQDKQKEQEAEKAQREAQNKEERARRKSEGRPGPREMAARAAEKRHRSSSEAEGLLMDEELDEGEGARAGAAAAAGSKRSKGGSKVTTFQAFQEGIQEPFAVHLDDSPPKDSPGMNKFGVVEYSSSSDGDTTEGLQDEDEDEAAEKLPPHKRRRRQTARRGSIRKQQPGRDGMAGEVWDDGGGGSGSSGGPERQAARQRRGGSAELDQRPSRAGGAAAGRASEQPSDVVDLRGEDPQVDVNLVDMPAEGPMQQQPARQRGRRRGGHSQPQHCGDQVDLTGSEDPAEQQQQQQEEIHHQGRGRYDPPGQEEQQQQDVHARHGHEGHCRHRSRSRSHERDGRHHKRRSGSQERDGRHHKRRSGSHERKSRSRSCSHERQGRSRKRHSGSRGRRSRSRSHEGRHSRSHKRRSSSHERRSRSRSRSRSHDDGRRRSSGQHHRHEQQHWESQEQQQQHGGVPASQDAARQQRPDKSHHSQRHGWYDGQPQEGAPRHVAGRQQQQEQRRSAAAEEVDLANIPATQVVEDAAVEGFDGGGGAGATAAGHAEPAWDGHSSPHVAVAQERSLQRSPDASSGRDEAGPHSLGTTSPNGSGVTFNGDQWEATFQGVQERKKFFSDAEGGRRAAVAWLEAQRAAAAQQRQQPQPPLPGNGLGATPTNTMGPAAAAAVAGQLQGPAGAAGRVAPEAQEQGSSGPLVQQAQQAGGFLAAQQVAEAPARARAAAGPARGTSSEQPPLEAPAEATPSWPSGGQAPDWHQQPQQQQQQQQGWGEGEEHLHCEMGGGYAGCDVHGGYQPDPETAEQQHGGQHEAARPLSTGVSPTAATAAVFAAAAAAAAAAAMEREGASAASGAAAAAAAAGVAEGGQDAAGIDEDVVMEDAEQPDTSTSGLRQAINKMSLGNSAAAELPPKWILPPLPPLRPQAQQAISEPCQDNSAKPELDLLEPPSPPSEAQAAASSEVATAGAAAGAAAAAGAGSAEEVVDLTGEGDDGENGFTPPPQQQQQQHQPSGSGGRPEELRGGSAQRGQGGSRLSLTGQPGRARKSVAPHRLAHTSPAAQSEVVQQQGGATAPVSAFNQHLFRSDSSQAAAGGPQQQQQHSGRPAAVVDPVPSQPSRPSAKITKSKPRGNPKGVAAKMLERASTAAAADATAAACPMQPSTGAPLLGMQQQAQQQAPAGTHAAWELGQPVSYVPQYRQQQPAQPGLEQVDLCQSPPAGPAAAAVSAWDRQQQLQQQVSPGKPARPFGWAAPSQPSACFAAMAVNDLQQMKSTPEAPLQGEWQDATAVPSGGSPAMQQQQHVRSQSVSGLGTIAKLKQALRERSSSGTLAAAGVAAAAAGQNRAGSPSSSAGRVSAPAAVSVSVGQEAHVHMLPEARRTHVTGSGGGGSSAARAGRERWSQEQAAAAAAGAVASAAAAAAAAACPGGGGGGVRSGSSLSGCSSRQQPSSCKAEAARGQTLVMDQEGTDDIIAIDT